MPRCRWASSTTEARPTSISAATSALRARWTSPSPAHPPAPRSPSRPHSPSPERSASPASKSPPRLPRPAPWGHTVPAKTLLAWNPLVSQRKFPPAWKRWKESSLCKSRLYQISPSTRNCRSLTWITVPRSHHTQLSCRSSGLDNFYLKRSFGRPCAVAWYHECRPTALY